MLMWIYIGGLAFCFGLIMWGMYQDGNFFDMEPILAVLLAFVLSLIWPVTLLLIVGLVIGGYKNFKTTGKINK